jgi:hypothetical protein
MGESNFKDQERPSTAHGPTPEGASRLYPAGPAYSARMRARSAHSDSPTGMTALARTYAATNAYTQARGRALVAHSRAHTAHCNLPVSVHAQLPVRASGCQGGPFLEIESKLKFEDQAGNIIIMMTTRDSPPPARRPAGAPPGLTGPASEAPCCSRSATATTTEVAVRRGSTDSGSPSRASFKPLPVAVPVAPAHFRAITTRARWRGPAAYLVGRLGAPARLPAVRLGDGGLLWAAITAVHAWPGSSFSCA